MTEKTAKTSEKTQINTKLVPIPTKKVLFLAKERRRKIGILPQKI